MASCCSWLQAEAVEQGGVDSVLLNDLIHFNKDAINEETVELLYPYLCAEDSRQITHQIAGTPSPTTCARGCVRWRGISTSNGMLQTDGHWSTSSFSTGDDAKCVLYTRGERSKQLSAYWRHRDGVSMITDVDGAVTACHGRWLNASTFACPPENVGDFGGRGTWHVEFDDQGALTGWHRGVVNEDDATVLIERSHCEGWKRPLAVYSSSSSRSIFRRVVLAAL